MKILVRMNTTSYMVNYDDIGFKYNPLTSNIGLYIGYAILKEITVAKNHNTDYYERRFMELDTMIDELRDYDTKNSRYMIIVKINNEGEFLIETISCKK